MKDGVTGSNKQSVPLYCYQCVAGPDLMRVEVEDGVAKRIVSNFDIAEEHPGGGRVCVKAYGLIQKTYNPHRIRQPMKRTNPNKGRDQDPGFVSYDVQNAQALNEAGGSISFDLKELPPDSELAFLAKITDGSGAVITKGCNQSDPIGKGNLLALTIILAPLE